jgi:hypothetical protein
MDAKATESDSPKRGGAGRAGAGERRDPVDIEQLCARARGRYGFTVDEFLICSPREFDLLLRDEHDQERERLVPAALICAVIANSHRDPDRRPEPWTPADFMPGAKSEEDEMREFVERVQRGDKFEIDPEAAESFKQQMQSMFSNVKPAGSDAGR